MAWSAFSWTWWLVGSVVVTSVSAVEIVRLPDAVVPSRYEVTLLPVIEENTRLCGHVWIDLTVKRATNVVVLHALRLKILQVVLQKSRADESDINSVVEETCFVSGINEEKLFSSDSSDLVDSFFLDEQYEQMTVKAKELLQPDTVYCIGIMYMGHIQEDDSRGFFRIQYARDEDGEKRWIGVTQLEATQARRVFPCFDEPRFKATFKLTVGHGRKYTALSNMPGHSTSKFKTTDKWVWSIFTETPPMATYLVACVITELDYVETIHHSISGRNVTVRLWSHGHRLGQLEFPKRFVPKVLGRLERYIRVPYTLPKLDIVAVPNHETLRAMENWGLIVHSESNLILTESDEGNPSIHKAIMSGTIVHELAHQFFGNLVTWYWWDNVWLHEGLATFFENVIVNDIAPEVNSDMVFTLYYAQSLTNDRIGGTVALNTPVEVFPMIESKFDGFSYIKGGALFRMVRNFIGHDAFQTAIYRYLSKFQFKNANSIDLWTLMNQEAHRAHAITDRKNVARIMNSWTEQTGFPLINVARTSNGSIRINQTAFYDGTHPLNEDITLKLWWIPVTVVTAEQKSFEAKDLRPIAWLTPKKPFIEVDAPRSNFSWVLVNPEFTAYCRVNYDEWLWRLISQQLMRDHNAIPPLTRAQLIDDAFILGQVKLVSYDTVLHLIEYMAYVDEVGYVRNAASVHVNRLISNLSINGAIPDTSTHLGSIVMRMYSIITDAESSLPQSRSAIIVNSLFENGPCRAGDDYCISEALRIYQSVMAGSTLKQSDQRVVSEHTEALWCTALRYGGQKEWDFAWNKTTSDGVNVMEQKLIIRAMTCSRDSQRINQLLSRVFHPDLNQKSTETSLLIKHLSQNSPIRPVVVRFVFRNLNFILTHLRKPSHFLDAMQSIIKRFDSEEEKRQFKILVLERARELGAANVKFLLSALD